MSNKHLPAAIDAFTKISEAKVTEQFIELIKIAQCADIALIAHAQLDMRFKNPIISNHLKRIADSSKAVRHELRANRKYGFKTADSEYTEDASAELYNLISIAVMFGKDGIAALTENLRLQLHQPEKVKEFWENMNDQLNEVA